MRDSTPLNFNRRLGRPFTMHLERINTSRLLPIEAPPRNGEITKAIYIYMFMQLDVHIMINLMQVALIRSQEPLNKRRKPLFQSKLHVSNFLQPQDVLRFFYLCWQKPLPSHWLIKLPHQRTLHSATAGLNINMQRTAVVRSNMCDSSELPYNMKSNTKHRGEFNIFNNGPCWCGLKFAKKHVHVHVLRFHNVCHGRGSNLTTRRPGNAIPLTLTRHFDVSLTWQALRSTDESSWKDPKNCNKIPPSHFPCTRAPLATSRKKDFKTSQADTSDLPPSNSYHQDYNNIF